MYKRQIFDTVKSATARGYDMVSADTAGRLHNKANLMAELAKISRSVKTVSYTHLVPDREERKFEMGVNSNGETGYRGVAC